MKIYEKKPIKTGEVDIGYILSLKDKIGLESDSKEFASLIQQINKIKTDFKANVILVDTTDLIRWDTYGLRAIIPTLLDANLELKAMNRAPISIIGDKNRDLYNAIVERWADKSNNIPWFESVDDFRNSYRV